MDTRIDQQLFAGVDWATKTHTICVVDAKGAILVRFEIANTGNTFSGLVKRLRRLDVHAVTIERCDGPVVEALIEADLRVVVITPRQVKGLRSRYSGSSAKPDAGDAYLPADVLRTDGNRLAALTQDREATQVFRSLTRTRGQCLEARILARPWIPVIWRCGQEDTADDLQLHGGAMQLNAA